MEIVRIDRESAPALRFIGKKYSADANFGAGWGQWWGNGWFDALDRLEGRAAINQDSYCAAKRIVNGELEYWIGMFFDPSVEAPEGYERVEMEPLHYAVCWLKDRENSPELTGLDAHNRCLEALKQQGMVRKEDDWCFERYQCPRYTTPDEEGKIILDYGIAIEA